MELRMKKVSLIAAAVTTALMAGAAYAENEVALDVTSGDSAMEVEVKNPTDVITDGWEIHGYMSSNYRLMNGETVDTEFNRPDYHSSGTSGQSTNQVEFVFKKHTEYQSGVWSDYVLRTEYGNGNSYAYDSQGSLKNNTTAQFEVKEAFVEIGALPYLGQDSSVWAGQRYLNRAAGIISGEFWKQSSGLGAGFQTKLAGHTAGIATISADTTSDINNDVNDDRQTVTTYDAYFYGVQALGGSFDFDLKYVTQANQTGDSADDGVGFSVTYNRDYYGFDGWTQTGIAYGEGAATNRGVNVGSWSGDFNKDSSGLFITSYGVANISDNIQLGTEFVYWDNDDFYGQDSVTRTMFAARPSFKINDNLRFEMTGSVSIEELADGVAWGRKDKNTYYTAEAALPITVNADYFGRPQIKPYVTYYATDEESKGGLSIDDSSEVIFGIHTEIWF
jgi:maltoporin